MPTTTTSRSKNGKPQAKYYAGRRAEYRTINLMENAGYLCIRAAGSKGPADVVAIGNGPPMLIQVKRGKRGLTVLEREKLTEIRRRLNCQILVHRWEKHARFPITEEIL
jgi:hypothetical protein